MLGYLGEIGLRPGASVTVLSSEPNGGPLVIEVDGANRAIARDVARSVEVR